MIFAIFAGAAGIYHATDAREIAFLKCFDVRADLHNATDNFVSRHARIRRAVPFVAGDVDIRVADAAIQNLNLHIVRAGRATLKVERRER